MSSHPWLDPSPNSTQQPWFSGSAVHFTWSWKILPGREHISGSVASLRIETTISFLFVVMASILSTKKKLFHNGFSRKERKQGNKGSVPLAWGLQPTDSPKPCLWVTGRPPELSGVSFLTGKIQGQDWMNFKVSHYSDSLKKFQCSLSTFCYIFFFLVYSRSR